MNSLYNAYLPHFGPYEKLPEDDPPGANSFGAGAGISSGLRGLLGKLDLRGIDSGDLLLLLILFLLLKEGDGADPTLLLTLAAALLLDG